MFVANLLPGAILGTVMILVNRPEEVVSSPLPGGVVLEHTQL